MARADIRESIAQFVEEQVELREFLAEESGEPRDTAMVAAMSALAAYVRSLPADDERLLYLDSISMGTDGRFSVLGEIDSDEEWLVWCATGADGDRAATMSDHLDTIVGFYRTQTIELPATILGRKTPYRRALHESGHLVVLLVLRGPDAIDFVWIERDPDVLTGDLGRMRQRAFSSDTAEDLLVDIMCTLGSRAVLNVANEDYVEFEEFARDAPKVTNQIETFVNMYPEHTIIKGTQFPKRTLRDVALTHAETLLKENWALVEAVVAALLASGHLDADELRQIAEANSCKRSNE